MKKKNQVGVDIHGMPVTSHTSSSPNHQADIRVFIYPQDRSIPPSNNGKLPTSIWGGLEPDLLGDVDYKRYLSSWWCPFRKLGACCSLVLGLCAFFVRRDTHARIHSSIIIIFFSFVYQKTKSSYYPTFSSSHKYTTIDGNALVTQSALYPTFQHQEQTHPHSPLVNPATNAATSTKASTNTMKTIT